MLVNSLVAGLFGAILAGVINFFVRRFLDQKSIELAEKRLAYVHFVRISALLAFEITLKNYIKIYTKDLKFGIGEAGRGYSISHEIAVLISTRLLELDSKKFTENAHIGMVVNFFESQVDDLKDNKLSFENLSKFPKSIINDYSNFLSHLGHFVASLDFWKRSIESGNFKWATPETIHDQWVLLQRISKAVGNVRSKMLNAGVVTPQEAKVLLKLQVDYFSNIYLENFLHKGMLDSASLAAKARGGCK